MVPIDTSFASGQAAFSQHSAKLPALRFPRVRYLRHHRGMKGYDEDFCDVDIVRGTLPHDRLREDPHATLQSVGRERHPVEVLQQQQGVGAREERLHWLAQVHGAHLPLRLLLEEQVMRRIYRPGGLSASFLGLEVLNGSIENIEPGEFFSQTDLNEFLDSRTHEVHSCMERKFGLELD